MQHLGIKNYNNSIIFSLLLICALFISNKICYATNFNDCFEEGLRKKRGALIIVAPQHFKDDEQSLELLKKKINSELLTEIFKGISQLCSSKQAKKQKKFERNLQSSLNAFHQCTQQDRDKSEGLYECAFISCLAGDEVTFQYYLSHLRALPQLSSNDDLISQLETVIDVRNSLRTQPTLIENHDGVLDILSRGASISVLIWGPSFFIHSLEYANLVLDPFWGAVLGLGMDMRYLFLPTEIEWVESVLVISMIQNLAQFPIQWSLNLYRRYLKSSTTKKSS